ncbi:MAG: RNA-binding protein [Pseudomonadota bacterium]
MLKREKASERTCALTRRKGPPSSMVRFVVSPDGVVTPDIRRRLPGRGVWIDATRDSVAAAVKRKVFARGFKAQVEVPQDLAATVAALLRQAALQRLAIAQKAGRVVCGFEKVRAALSAGPVAGLLCAADAAADGRDKLVALAKKAQDLHKSRVLADVFSSDELGGTLGRDRVVHVALSPGQASDFFFTDALRLRGFEFGPTDDADNREQREPMFAGPLTV